MAKRKRKGRGRSPAAWSGPAAPHEPRATGWGRDDPSLIRDVRGRMERPLDLLVFISAFLNMVDPRSEDPFTPPEFKDRVPYDRPGLLQSFVDVERPETTALLAAVAALTDDHAERKRLRAVVAGRDDTLPAWLAGMDGATPLRAVALTHTLGDGDDLILGVRLPSGDDLTAVLYVDHNLSVAAKDGFVLAEHIDETVAFIRDKADEDSTFIDIPLADARVKIMDAINHGAMFTPRFETETWPACRPILEWMARLLPEGGQGYPRQEWTDEDRAEITRRFLASPHGTPFTGEDDRDMLEHLLWFGCGYGPGDPFHWSPMAVEIVLVDWIPRKIMADVDFLDRAPDVLRGFIRFCHEERSIRPGLTDRTLAEVDVCEPEYRTIIRTPRAQGPFAQLEASGALKDVDWADDEYSGWNYADFLRRDLEHKVGGAKALAALDTAPLPDEPFDWSGIPPDVTDRVTEVLALCDRCADALFDVEFRTAARRFLARITVDDPALFRRRAKAENAAAAVCWIIGKANGQFDPWMGIADVRVADVAEHFGIGPGAFYQRAATMMRAAGLDDRSYSTSLESPRYLTTAFRADVIRRRDALGRDGE